MQGSKSMNFSVIGLQVMSNFVHIVPQWGHDNRDD